MFQQKIFKDTDIIKKQIDNWKNNGDQIVFTNGCFDLIHIGHISYLDEAKSLGDRLVIGVNSDESVQRLKGVSRPIKDESNRVGIIAALSCVDMVVLFGEDTPLDLIKLIIPDILVKGGDWRIDQIVGSSEVISNGGEVKSLQFLDGYSSTALIDKIKNEK